NTAMSHSCTIMWNGFPDIRIEWARRRNFRILEDRLRGSVALVDKTLADGVCPLFFPLLASNKHAAAGALAKQGIESIEFWNSGDPESHRAGSGAEFLRRHLLEIPIHQDVTPEAAEYTAKEILRLRVGMPA